MTKKLELDMIQTIIDTHNVPYKFQKRLLIHIMKQGFDSASDILDNHKKGGVIFSREEYIRI